MQASLERLRHRREELGDQGGFTLIELLIVIVILGILAAIVVFAVQNLTSESSQAACQSDYKTTETALEVYKAQMGNYPDGNGSATQVSPNTDSDAATVNAAAANEELLTAADTAPNFAAVTPPTNAAPIGPWLKDVPANPGHYTIVVLNNGDGAITVDNGTGTPITPVAGQSPCLQLTS